MTEDEELKARLKAWEIAPPDDATRDRLMAMALRQPQKQSFVRWLGDEVARSLSDWSYRPGYKIAAFAACLMLGVGIGFSLDEPVDVAGVALVGTVGTPS